MTSTAGSKTKTSRKNIDRPHHVPMITSITGKKIAIDLDISTWLETLARRNAFINIKDYKLHFTSNARCHLINHAKSETGLVSKNILRKLNKDIRRVSYHIHLVIQLRCYIGCRQNEANLELSS